MKQGLQIIERFLILGFVACISVFIWQKLHPVTPAKIYKFRGVFCGMELWEYSASGSSIAIWPEFQTNATEIGIVIRTNTVDEFVKRTGGIR